MTIIRFTAYRSPTVSLGDVAQLIEARERLRGIWRKGVKSTALEPLGGFARDCVRVGDIRRTLLDGSSDWQESSRWLGRRTRMEEL